MRVGYARVSTKDQSLDLQVDALKKAKCDEVFCEVASGAKPHDPFKTIFYHACVVEMCW